MFARFLNHPLFEVVGGIPRHRDLLAASDAQAQTSDTFSFKWAKRDTYEGGQIQDFAAKWLEQRYGSRDEWRERLPGKTILDAGCGSGYSAVALFGDALNECKYIGMDISTSVEVGAERFRERGLKGSFVQCSVDNIPEDIRGFDFIFSEGVLHHTDSTERAVKHLAGKLAPGGTLMFYVYAKKGPIREFTDDYIRERIRPLRDEEAWNALEPLSELGRQLGDLKITLDIERPIDVLDIPAGKIDLQRLFYYHLFKCFYRPEFSLDEMNHINFDWYRPLNCHRQTAEEVDSWLRDAGLAVERLHKEESGITAIASRPV